MTKSEINLLVGKKVTCKINGKIIKDARLQMVGDQYYICNNIVNGQNLSADLKLGYRFDWCISNGTAEDLHNNSIFNLKLVDEVLTEYEIY